jgi:hypothetical protein
MIDITLVYKPFKILPWKRHIKARLPIRWSELTEEQIIAIPDMRRGLVRGPRMIQIFLGIKWSVARCIDGAQVKSILKYLLYLQEPEPFGTFLIKEIAGYRAPDPRLSGVTLGAFLFGYIYYMNYKSGKKDDLDRFIACFYSPWRGFDDAFIELHADIIRLGDIARREAIAINFELILEWLVKTYSPSFQIMENIRSFKKVEGWLCVSDCFEGDLEQKTRCSYLPLIYFLKRVESADKNL